MKRFILQIIFLILSFHRSQGYIYEIQILRIWDNNLNNYRYVIGYSDFHDKKHEATHEHRLCLESIAKNNSATKASFLIEDLDSTNICNTKNCGPYLLNNKGSLLGGLAHFCSTHGHEVYNLEYRYCRVAALAPHINQSLDVNQCSAKNILIEHLIAELHMIKNIIAAYNDGTILNRWYKKSLEELEKQCKKLKLYDNKEQSVFDYIQSHKPNQVCINDFIKHLLTFDSFILDSTLIHHAATSQKRHTFAIAGGTHINRMVHILRSAGYELIFSKQSPLKKEYSLNRCIGSHINKGSFCLKPEALTLDILIKDVNSYIQ